MTDTKHTSKTAHLKHIGERLHCDNCGRFISEAQIGGKDNVCGDSDHYGSPAYAYTCISCITKAKA